MSDKTFDEIKLSKHSKPPVRRSSSTIQDAVKKMARREIEDREALWSQYN